MNGVLLRSAAKPQVYHYCGRSLRQAALAGACLRPDHMVKVKLAARLREETTMTEAWIASGCVPDGNSGVRLPDAQRTLVSTNTKT
jgi:hypothetical protein